MSRVRCALVGSVAACALAGPVVSAPAALADDAPDLSASRFHCQANMQLTHLGRNRRRQTCCTRQESYS